MYDLSNRGNSDDLESVTFKVISTASLSNVIFRTALQQLTSFQTA